ncbi:DNA primase, partial [Staphylococcus caprae]
ITTNEQSDRSSELFSDNNNPLSEYLENRNVDFFLNNPGADTYKDYKTWCHSNFVRNPVEKNDFITLLENYYGIKRKRSVKY